MAVNPHGGQSPINLLLTFLIQPLVQFDLLDCICQIECHKYQLWCGFLLVVFKNFNNSNSNNNSNTILILVLWSRQYLLRMFVCFISCSKLSNREPPTFKPNHSFAFADKWLVKSSLSVTVITEARSGYIFYYRMEDGKLSWPMHTSEDAYSQYLKLQYYHDCCDKCTNKINAKIGSCTHTITLPPDHFDLWTHMSAKLWTTCQLLLPSTAGTRNWAPNQ